MTLLIVSNLSNEFLKIQASILLKVTSQLPVELLNTENIDHVKIIMLAGEDFMKPRKCDIILRSDCFFTIWMYGKISVCMYKCMKVWIMSQLPKIALPKLFGWLVARKMEPKSKYSSIMKSHFLSVENESNVDVLWQKFG